jgi:hypothetical protein
MANEPQRRPVAGDGIIPLYLFGFAGRSAGKLHSAGSKGLNASASITLTANSAGKPNIMPV